MALSTCHGGGDIVVTLAGSSRKLGLKDDLTVGVSIGCGPFRKLIHTAVGPNGDIQSGSASIGIRLKKPGGFIIAAFTLPSL